MNTNKKKRYANCFYFFLKKKQYQSQSYNSFIFNVSIRIISVYLQCALLQQFHVEFEKKFLGSAEIWLAFRRPPKNLLTPLWEHIFLLAAKDKLGLKIIFSTSQYLTVNFSTNLPPDWQGWAYEIHQELCIHSDIFGLYIETHKLWTGYTRCKLLFIASNIDISIC